MSLRILFVPLLIAFVACGASDAPPTFEPLPSPTSPPFEPLPSPTFSAGFNTFTDELNLFTISYPPDWELALSLVEDMGEIVKDAIKSKQSDTPVENAGIVFLAGVPIEGGYEPSVHVGVESLPERLEVAEYAERSLRYSENFYAGFRLHNQASVRLGNRDARIID